MSTLLIRSAIAPDLVSQHWITTGDAGIYLGDGLSPVPEGATIIEQDGIVLDQDEYLAIRPLGNIEGQATGSLLYQHFAGEPQWQMTPEADDPVVQAYPEDNCPFEIIIDHHWYEQAEFSGWGFLAEISGGAASRDPSVRAMAVYSDQEHTQYLWTGGAFQQGPSRLGQVDAEGVPLTVWFSDTPAGFRTADKTPWNLAVLWSSVQEGTCVLSPDSMVGLRLQFWDHDQSSTPTQGADWVDTGATVTQLVGSGTYRVSAVIPDLVKTQAIKLGTSETTFNGYWPTATTPSDYLTITPHVTAAVGAKVWKWA